MWDEFKVKTKKAIRRMFKGYLVSIQREAKEARRYASESIAARLRAEEELMRIMQRNLEIRKEIHALLSEKWKQ